MISGFCLYYDERYFLEKKNIFHKTVQCTFLERGAIKDFQDTNGRTRMGD